MEGKKIILKLQGGLGNQLFQYSSARKLSDKTDSKLYLDLSFYEDERFQGIYRLDRFNIRAKTIDKDQIRLLKNERIHNKIFSVLKRLNLHCRYNKKTHFIELKNHDNINTLNNLKPPIYIEGWLNNFNFFSNIKNDLEKEFKLKEISSISNSQDYININKDDKSVAIHVRGGDYISNPYFANLTINYYQKAISLISERIGDANFYIFSDDIDLAKSMFNETPNCTFMNSFSTKQTEHNTTNDIWDLFLMNTCKHIIIANSTFSWWAAWLNSKPEKIVISPIKWYNDEVAQKHIENIDFFPENWILI